MPLADFHPLRHCRDFDALWEFAREGAIPDYRTKWHRLQVLEGAKVLPAPTPRLYPPRGRASWLSVERGEGVCFGAGFCGL